MMRISLGVDGRTGPRSAICYSNRGPRVIATVGNRLNSPGWNNKQNVAKLSRGFRPLSPITTHGAPSPSSDFDGTGRAFVGAAGNERTAGQRQVAEDSDVERLEPPTHSLQQSPRQTLRTDWRSRCQREWPASVNPQAGGSSFWTRNTEVSVRKA